MGGGGGVMEGWPLSVSGGGGGGGERETGLKRRNKIVRNVLVILAQWLST